MLIVGDGPHDIGSGDGDFGQPRKAGGVITGLCRRACPSISIESRALRWAEISRFSKLRAPGYRGKVVAAALLSARRFNLEGTICVADRDRDELREAELLKGQDDAVQQLSPAHPVIVGVAVESIESWTLGATEALAAELGMKEEHLRASYPAGVDVESLYEQSGKELHRPKALLGRIAALGHQQDSVALREAVAERTDVELLGKVCPRGFAPFLTKLRATLRQSE